MDNKKYYSWIDFVVDSKSLFDEIKEEFDCIVGISRGGIFLAGMMSQWFDSRNVYLVSYYGGGSGDGIITDQEIHQELRNKTILLVDDISDKGHTLKKVVADLRNLGNTVITATLHYKPGTVFMPDYVMRQETAWIVYPWEME